MGTPLRSTPWSTSLGVPLANSERAGASRPRVSSLDFSRAFRAVVSVRRRGVNHEKG
jgi:hypothetical protein